MTPPTLHELAGIFMLALATAVLIAHPSAESHASVVTGGQDFTQPEPFLIDGIEPYILPQELRR